MTQQLFVDDPAKPWISVDEKSKTIMIAIPESWSAICTVARQQAGVVLNCVGVNEAHVVVKSLSPKVETKNVA